MTTYNHSERPNYIPSDIWDRFTVNIDNSDRKWPMAVRAEDLTFGVEIETHIDRDSAGRLPMTGWHGSGTVGSALPRFEGGEWQASRDGSIVTPTRDRIDCEFVSPILRGKAGLENLVKVIKIAKANAGESVEFDGQTYTGCGARVNSSCGVHVHVAFPTRDLKCLQRLVALVAAFEDGIYASTGTKRREQNRYCAKTKTDSYKRAANRSRSRDEFERNHRDRYFGLNLENLLNGRYNAVEFRFFSGSTNPVKIAAYTQLCIGIVQLALSMARPAKWDSSPASSSHAGKGQGERELNRLLQRLEWTGGKGWLGPCGILCPEGDDCTGLPSKRAMIRKLREMARAYDEQP